MWLRQSSSHEGWRGRTPYELSDTFARSAIFLFLKIAAGSAELRRFHSRQRMRRSAERICSSKWNSTPLQWKRSMQWEVQNVILKSVKNDGSQYHAKGTVYWAVFL